MAREGGENTDGNSRKKRNEDKESTLLIGDMKLHGQPVPTIQPLGGWLFSFLHYNYITFPSLLYTQNKYLTGGASDQFNGRIDSF